MHYYLRLAMVVAVSLVLMVQMSFNQIVRMVAVGYSFMPAIGAVLVVCRMAAAFVAVGAVLGVGSGYSDFVLIDMPIMRGVQMTVVQVICVAVVLDCSVAAASAVLMRMALMDCMFCVHSKCSFEVGR